MADGTVVQITHEHREARQRRSMAWAVEVFGTENAYSRRIRALRFLEEAIELVQTQGLTEADVATVGRYVYGRPIGKVSQEIGGVTLSLNILAENLGLSVDHCEATELSSVLTADPKKFRDKQVLKTASGLI